MAGPSARRCAGEQQSIPGHKGGALLGAARQERGPARPPDGAAVKDSGTRCRWADGGR
ncbi:hypothetical protein [Actinomyces ruminicola]|uniref:hypothetical protein n=1 Tax=Actinomyces ruminicola TaxID=332524 RepID=UPI00164FCD7C|nr:hypothetical protein [Actinomyces ruminicola]